MSIMIEDLKAFSLGIAEKFNSGGIRAPVHLDGGNEEPLIQYFDENYRLGDWVCGTWRMHYKCLLAGVPKDALIAAILRGRSITLCFAEYKIISSAIVGGILPIALGIALGIKCSGGGEIVHVFIGDMAALTGAFHECREYAVGWGLPIKFIVEDNGKSVVTPTLDTWGLHNKPNPDSRHERQMASGNLIEYSKKTFYFKYELPWPHSGAGVRVNF